MHRLAKLMPAKWLYSFCQPRSAVQPYAVSIPPRQAPGRQDASSRNRMGRRHEGHVDTAPPGGATTRLRSTASVRSNLGFDNHVPGPVTQLPASTAMRPRLSSTPKFGDKRTQRSHEQASRLIGGIPRAPLAAQSTVVQRLPARAPVVGSPRTGFSRPRPR